MLRHIRLMLGYNTRMNRQIYRKAQLLTDVQRKQNMKAYFGSIHCTLNHLLVGDLLWLRRFHEQHPHFTNLENLCFFPTPTALDEELYDDFGIMLQAREQLDRIMEMWGASDLKAADLTRAMKYSRMTADEECCRNFGELVLHLLNHQTHHRGQLSTLLMQCGHDVGITDFLYDVPEVKVRTA